MISDLPGPVREIALTTDVHGRVRFGGVGTSMGISSLFEMNIQKRNSDLFYLTSWAVTSSPTLMLALGHPKCGYWVSKICRS